MKLNSDVIKELRVSPGKPAGLKARGTSGSGRDWFGAHGHTTPDKAARSDLEGFKKELESAQELLFANDTWALLLIFQAMDAGGKDGTIKHVMSGVNPQGCEVHSFKQPSSEELDHDFLWRCAKALPARGRIGIFNRSYYEEVLVVRVHPELLGSQHLPPGTKAGKTLWRQRYADINAFERHQARSGTRIVKFFLHLSKAEQRRRFLDRLDDPSKQWKFSAADLAERPRFDAYQEAYEDALTATSTQWAPWYVIPADDKPVMRALVGGIILDEIERLHLRAPTVGPEQAAVLAAAREALLAEHPEDRGAKR